MSVRKISAHRRNFVIEMQSFNLLRVSFTLIFLWLLPYVSAAKAVDFVSVTHETDRPSLAPYLLHTRLTASQKLPVEEEFEKIQSLGKEHWQLVDKDVPSFGFSSDVFWFQLKLKNSLSEDLNLMLSVNSPVLDNIRFYVNNQRNETQYFQMGDSFPFSSRIIVSPNFVLPLDFKPQEQITVYLRVESQSAIQVPIILANPADYYASNNTVIFLQGLYLGLLLIMALFNLFLFIALKENVYLYFSTLLFSYFSFHIGLNGLGFQYLWPEFAILNSKWIPFSLAGFSLSCCFFMQEFLQLKENKKHYHQMLRVFTLLVALGAVASIFLSYSHSVQMFTYAALPLSTFAIWVSAILLFQGLQVARFFLWAWLVFIAFGVILSLSKLGFIPRNIFTEHSVQIGSVFTVILMSFALADRINFNNRKRREAQNKALDSQKQASREKERFFELTLASQQEEMRAKAKALRAESQSKAKSDFLATMSHEIRTPMNGVLGAADVLKNSGLNPEQSEYVAVIESSGKSLLAVINDILDYSQIEAGKLKILPEAFELESLCQECLAGFYIRAKQKGILLAYNNAKGAPANLYSDPLRLRQVLTNLLDNAFKFTKEGEISLSVTYESAAPEENEGHWLKFTVQDTGIGIDKNISNQLFKEFSQADNSTQRDYGVTGLGLSISKKLVEMLGGEIGVTSTLGQGSTFWFTISAQAASQEQITVEQLDSSASKTIDTLSSELSKQEITKNMVKDSAAKTALPLFETNSKSNDIKDEKTLVGKSILVAEDNPINQMVIKAMLVRLGAKITMVEDGEKALQQVKENHSQFDMLLMDCEMPNLDGYEATKKIREWEEEQNKKMLPIIAQTAHALEQYREKSRQAGMNGHVSKPIEIEKLRSALAEFI